MANVLLVEDNPLLSQEYAESLDKYGFRVISVYDGSEVEEIIDKENIDIVVSDTDMPLVPGNVACKQLLDSGKIKNKLIVGMSSSRYLNEYWKGIAHNFIPKKKIHNLGKIIQTLYMRFKENPNMQRYGDL